MTKKKSNLVQKTYYLDKDMDREILEYLKKVRNASEFIRNAILHEIQDKSPTKVQVKEEKVEKIQEPEEIDQPTKEMMGSFLGSIDL